MARLTTKARKSLRSSTFGLPKQRKYPMPNRAHARDAKARASEMAGKGRLSGSQEREIDAKANRILGEKGNAPRLMRPARRTAGKSRSWTGA